MRKLIVGSIWFVVFYLGVAFPIGVFFAAEEGSFEKIHDHTTEVAQRDEQTLLGNFLLGATLLGTIYGTITGQLPGSQDPRKRH